MLGSNDSTRWAMPVVASLSLVAVIAGGIAAYDYLAHRPAAQEAPAAATSQAPTEDQSRDGAATSSSATKSKSSVGGMKSAPAEKKDDEEKWTGGKETVDLSSRMGPGVSIFDLISAGELIPEEPTPETEDPEEAKEFPSVWTGSFEGFDSDGNPEHKDVEMKFDEVNAAGYIKGVCTIDSHDMGPNAVEGSYTVEGFVNWETDDIELWGTSWVQKGEIDVMRHYYGTLNSSYTAIQGSCVTLEGKGETKWTMVAN